MDAMRNKHIIFITVIAWLLFLPFLASAKPKVWIDNPVFTFEAIPEGVNVPHEFIIKNIGDSLLKIDNVLPP